jgi:NADH-quinone oxidoreductase subunit L
MGGLRKKMPLTFIVALVAALALIGMPLTSGYLSKDGILIQAFEWSDGKAWSYRLIPLGAILSTWLTAFYVSRLIVKVFMGQLRVETKEPLKLHVGDGSWQFRVPMIVLALCCLFPLFSNNPLLYENAWIMKGFSVGGSLERMDIYHTLIPAGVNLLSIIIMYAAYSLYIKKQPIVFATHNWLYSLSFQGWYFDKMYNIVFVEPVLALSKRVFWVDTKVIDGFINGLEKTTLLLAKTTAWIDAYIIDGFLQLIASIAQGIGNFARYFQRGKVQFYLLSMLAILLLIFILRILI